jgi:hypothetical protein
MMQFHQTLNVVVSVFQAQAATPAIPPPLERAMPYSDSRIQRVMQHLKVEANQNAVTVIRRVFVSASYQSEMTHAFAVY